MDSGEWMVFLNGKFVPECDAKVSVFDAGFHLGDTVLEVARTFNYKPFKLKEHLRRLSKSMRSTRMDAGLSMEELEAVCLKLLEANRHRVRENEDVWIAVSITRGILPMFRDVIPSQRGATVVVNCRPIPFEDYAEFYETGAHVVVPSRRHIPPECLDPKLKTRSRIHFVLAEMEARLTDPEAYPLLLDVHGNITESTGANFFIASKGVLKTPTSRNILCGISRQTVLELAGELGLRTMECDLQVYDVENADEAFLTSTSKCVLPVSRINSIPVGSEVPGPITERLLAQWSQKVGLDIVGQALRHARKEGVG